MATWNGPKKPKAKTDLLAVSKVLQTLLANGKSPLSDQFLRWKIWRFWPQIVGPTFANFCEPVGFDRGRIYLWVKSAARMQEMRFFEDQLREKINQHVGRTWCKNIRFTLDRRGIPAEVSEEFKSFLAGGDEPPPESL